MKFLLSTVAILLMIFSFLFWNSPDEFGAKLKQFQAGVPAIEKVSEEPSDDTLVTPTAE